MSVSPNVQAIICEEVFDEASHPSIEEIQEYATKIGIDPENEPHLLHLAKEGLMQALPSPWKPCFDEKSKSYYYYNNHSGKTQWEHPLDDIYRNMVVKVRSGSQASFDEDSKAHEENTYTKEDLQSYEESLPKPPPFTKPVLSPLKKLEPIGLGARKKDIKLSPVQIKSKSMQDFSQKSNDFLFDGTGFGKRRGSRTNVLEDLDSDKNTENKSFLLKNDKHPNSIEKGELTLSGGGSMFLKSNTKKLTEDNTLNDTKNIDNDHLLKSILRDRETHINTSLSEDKKQDDDEKKFVRFNLVTKDIDFNFSEKSTSDEEIEIFIEPKTQKTEIKSRFTVSPVFDEFNTSKRSESIFEKIENSEKLEEASTPRNSSLKLIKPNPTDFITPKLIAKNTELSKPVLLIHSDSEDESGTKYKAKFPKVESIIIEKSNIQDSIPEEDKSIDVSSTFDKKELIDTASSPIQDVDDNYKKKLHTELENEFEDYKNQLKVKNEQKIKDYEKILLDSKNKAMDKLKNDIMESQNVEFEEFIANEKVQQEAKMKEEINNLQSKMQNMYDEAMKQEEQKLQEKLEQRRIEIEKRYEQNIEAIENTFKDKEKEIENNFQMSLKQTEKDFILKLDERIKEISTAQKAVIDRMKDDHNITIEELARDFKSEEEIIRREHYQNLADLKDKLHHELEIERQRMRDLGEDRLYEKVRCEKRLLEDKYRCLKEKYIRLKTDVKTSLEKRSRRKEQSLTTTGSDTERSTSHKRAVSSDRNINSHDTKTKNAEHETGTPKHQSKSNSDINSNRSKPEIKNIRQITIEDIDTSMSDRSINPNDNNKKDFDSSDGVSNVGRNRRKLFTRLKSSSTSRLNNNSGKSKETTKRSCSPVENLRRQLQKLEDLEDQFPHAAQADTYHLRYPFSDAGDIGGSSELEFFRHRIHLERDSVRRAKENLRVQKSNFQKRQRELKVRHGSAARSTLQQLYQEERELSDMEVSLHRTRSLLGEKVIRLRHLEQSLHRMSVPSKLDDATLSDLSSHSASSGISSTEFATATDHVGKTAQFQEENFQESSEIIQSLENLNSEIREIWDVLNKQQSVPKVTAVMPPVPLVFSDQIWPMAGNITVPTLNAIPTLADRLQDYHQRAALASQSVQSIVVTQPPRASALGGQAVTTTLVERTKNLRDWLRQGRSDSGDSLNPGQATL